MAPEIELDRPWACAGHAANGRSPSSSATAGRLQLTPLCVNELLIRCSGIPETLHAANGIDPGEPAPTTDDRGQFRAHGIPQGRYFVCAAPRPPRGPAVEWTYGRSCFPLPVNVRGADMRVSAIQLERKGAYSIAGRIIDTAGDSPSTRLDVIIPASRF